MTGDPTRDNKADRHDLNSPPSSDYEAEAQVRDDKAAARAERQRRLKQRERKQKERMDAAHEKAKAERYEDACGRVITVVDGLVDTACGRPSGHNGGCRPVPLAGDREDEE